MSENTTLSTLSVGMVRSAYRLFKSPVVVAFGNPLLDIIVTVEDDHLFKKFDLKEDDELELPEETVQQLISELPPELKQTVSAGGSVQNTMRILQWLCAGPTRPAIGIYCGGLGMDFRGSVLENLVRLAGVNARYAVHPELPTGVCVSLIQGATRSLVANIGAAGVYTMEDLKREELSLDGVKLIYIEGFFVIHSLDVARELEKLGRAKGIPIAFNLNGAYLFKEHHAAICEMVGLARIVFGNAREMTALAQALNINYDDVTDIPFLLNNLKRVTIGVSSAARKEWYSNDSVFVMTQGGSAPAIVVWGQGQCTQVQPETLKVPVVDTTGAGDALVAGFLAGMLAGWTPKCCLKFGCEVAGFIVTRLGVTLPDSVPVDLKQ
ncbi:adenosine kinase [Orussus abietinus]|uniref:adenosine kinase n=1 Tax=Orussus abietinus TaxID=222816 RepID=UPI00062509A3|nr:adenosine kinase [Orussus abietinus]